jgi:hypothetical protein
MYSRAAILCAALLAVSTVLAADEKPAPDKPAPEKPTPEKPKATLKEGADLPGSFRPYIVANGKYEKKFHSLITENGLNPGVLIFAQNLKLDKQDSPLPMLLRELDKYIVDKPKTRLKGFAIFLDNDLADVVKDDDVRESHIDALQKLKSDEKQPLHEVVLALDSAPALQKAGYEIDPQWQVVVVLYDKLKVTKIYRSSEEGKLDVKGIMDEVKTNLAPYKK